ARALAETGKHRPRLIEDLRHLAIDGHRLLDLAPLLDGNVADFEHTVDEEAQALLRRDATSAHMRAVEQTELFEVLHDISDRRGRKAEIHHARERARSDRLAGLEIRLDEPCEDRAAAPVQITEGWCCFRLRHSCSCMFSGGYPARQ